MIISLLATRLDPGHKAVTIPNLDNYVFGQVQGATNSIYIIGAGDDRGRLFDVPIMELVKAAFGH